MMIGGCLNRTYPEIFSGPDRNNHLYTQFYHEGLRVTGVDILILRPNVLGLSGKDDPVRDGKTGFPCRFPKPVEKEQVNIFRATVSFLFP